MSSSPECRRKRWGMFAACLCALTFAALTGAEDASAPAEAKPGNVENTLTVDAIQARLAHVPDVAGLDDAAKAELTQTYNEALNQLKLADEWAKKAALFDETQKSGASDIAGLEAQDQQPPAAPRVDAPAYATVPQLEQLLSQRETDLEDAKAAQTAVEDDLFLRDVRRKQIPDFIAEAKQHLADAQASVGETAANGTPPEIAEAQRMLAAAQQQAARNEIDSYEKELQVFDLRGQLLRLRLSTAETRVSEKEKSLGAWRDCVTRRRQEEAKRAVDQARAVLMEAANASPQVRELAKTLADENAELVDRRIGPQGLLAAIERPVADLQKIEEQLKQVKDDFTGVTQKVEAAGLNNAVGHLLRHYKTVLPDLGEHRQDMRKRQDLIARVQMDRIELNDQRRGLGDLEAVLAKYVAMADLPADPKRQSKLEGSLRGLLKAKRDNVNALLHDYDSYFDKLLETDAAERELIAQTQLFSDYIDERVLWIRSGKSFDFVDLRSIHAAAEWLAGAAQSRTIPRTLRSDTSANPALYIIAGLAFAALLWGCRRLTRFLPLAAELAECTTCTAILPTVEALAATAVLALPPVAVIGFAAWRLSACGYAMDFGRAVGDALGDAAAISLAFGIARQTLRSKGLSESHFDWPAATLRSIRRHIAWLAPITIVLVFFLDLLQWHADELWIESLGQILLLITLAAFLLFGHLLLRPRKGTIPAIRNRMNPEGKRGWNYATYAIGVALPILMILLALNGYFYTAFKLSARLFETACLAAGLLILRGVVLRWLLVARRRLAIEQARKRRELAQKHGDESTGQEADQHEIDLVKSDAQTYRIIQSVAIVLFFLGAWLIWSNELPALRVLDRIELWQTSAPAAAPAGDTQAKKVGAPHEDLVPVTLADLLTAIVIAVLTFIATSNVPGFLELTVLQRLRYLKGERYAITTIVRYALAVTGAMLAFNAIGMGWAKVQWLVAALGLGLGFGLQEIFANFVSGLIILVERPIRVGDTVTVGDSTGTVSSIRTRATWITDANGKQFIVPNKEFVTKPVTNSTLSNAIPRIGVPVSVAPGSDTGLVETVLYQVARANPSILANPAPVVLFTGFGDNSLNVELRVSCTEVDQVRHNLYRAIDKAFREAGIEIAFSQRDIRIRPMDAPPPAIPPKSTK